MLALCEVVLVSCSANVKVFLTPNQTAGIKFLSHIDVLKNNVLKEFSFRFREKLNTNYDFE